MARYSFNERAKNVGHYHLSDGFGYVRRLFRQCAGNAEPCQNVYPLKYIAIRRGSCHLQHWMHTIRMPRFFYQPAGHRFKET